MKQPLFGGFAHALPFRFSLKNNYFLCFTFLFALALFSCADNTKKPNKDAKAAQEQGTVAADSLSDKAMAEQLMAAPAENSLVLTIAEVITSADKKTVTVHFNEREQPFTIDAAQKDIVAVVAKALKSKKPVKVSLDPKTSLLVTAAALTAVELTAFQKTALPTIQGAKLTTIDLKTVDTSKFNLMAGEPKALAAGCNNWIIPDYNTAVNIFNFCAAQRCIIGPTVVQPCIPFQYVRDGCHARAHKMRDIIENRYGYCTQKVFSYGIAPNNLSVRASKWGNCCVTWWFHVAPIVLVKVNGINYYYVIDPGMFNAPVSLTTWLQAQANTSCNAKALVTKYSIQPSTAYTPANYNLGTYTTDANYASTNSILTAYRNLKTCP
jgi:hypothetical protein